MEDKFLLSLDGGGVRELATVTFLSNLEKALGEPLYKKFDFFIGTSAALSIVCIIGAINSL